MKKWVKLLLLAVMVSLVAAMAPNDVQAATTVKLNKKALTTYVGGKTTLKMTGSAKKGTWSSSSKAVATVSSAGVITAKREGTAVITVKSGNKKATCRVTVKKQLSKKQAIAKVNSRMKKTKNITIKIYVKSPAKKNYLGTVAFGEQSKVLYMEMPVLEMKTYQTADKKLYWYDVSAKRWYYEKTDDDQLLELSAGNAIISKNAKTKLLGTKNFDGKKCAVLQNTEANTDPVIYYLDLADYSLKGMESGTGEQKEVLVIDLKTEVKLPASVKKKASYKEMQ